ncbi:uncharacterized protein LOC128557130 isoform X2 [Mercenaria mercenaria]|uniref:uncharacterized protein LOC128557130 isoform X2 n=1 Tax=Mercenaria mercenaria TaxID=6596 RepID=UPI00234E8898|nr:uncharacterized protein LOC128557130 isoform X2 [Mercenaria mercenaria]
MARYNVDLPHDKDFHLFVCYESNKINEVRLLVGNLEQNGIKCCYYERDFTAGCSIMENMYRAITKSMYMLVVLSEEFINSVYCLHELDEALNLKIKGDYNLIPVKIEPCVIPECIRHLTYIDAEEEIETAHTKIIDAVINKAKNGKHLSFTAKGYKTSNMALSRYRIHLSDTDKGKIWNSGFEISANLLDEVEETINGSLFMRWQHIWKHSYLIISVIFIFLLLFSLMLFLLLLLTTSGKERTNIYQPAGYVLIIVIPGVISVGIICLLLNCLFENKWRGIFKIYLKTLGILRDETWRISVENFEQTGTIFYILAYGANSPGYISLNIMRYNFRTCQAYFARRLETRETLKSFCLEQETAEECTIRLFDKFVRNRPEYMETPSSTQRHKMANSAKCVCLLVEEWLDSQMK